MKAREEGYDVCILDTAGRLQTQTNLMQQLDKIRRVIGKQIEGAPHEVLLVLDATAGQNALSQAKGFSEAAGARASSLQNSTVAPKGRGRSDLEAIRIAREARWPWRTAGRHGGV